jgi:predicted 3-demethylubiquinone-9 3-methyltransferase (glyoxalase superfamily)
MQKITPFLWFNNEAEEAVRYYTSVFRNSKMGKVARYGKDSPGPVGSVMTASFELDGQEFTALNGGPHFKFSEAISFVINCSNQDEIDEYWEKLSAGGETQQCGWLKDKFGLSWQIVPTVLPDLLTGKDATRISRVTQALLKMTKIDIRTLEEAYEGNAVTA